MYRIRIKWFLTSLVSTILLSACALGEEAVTPSTDRPPGHVLKIEALEDQGAAPELENEVWLNSDVPLRLSELRGRVVLLDFWTFG